MLLEVEGDTLYASQRPNSLHPLLTSVGIKSIVLKHRNGDGDGNGDGA